jgi:cobalamin biosynthesis Mg chelatase CobN
MNVGKRHRRAPQWAYLSLLMSVIALALACFPVLAQAECTSSSCVQYTESIPKGPEGENAPTHHQKTPAKASKTGNKGGSEPSQSDGSKGAKEAEGSGKGEASEKESGVVPGHDGDNGQGKPGGSAHGNGQNALNPGAQNKSGVQASSSDGGSSPLVPILIAIAVLAAISVAVVMIRQRRQRRGPTATASPEAN